MFSIGKTKPVKSIVGTMRPMREVRMAACCVRAEPEMRSPRESAVRIKSRLSAMRNGTLPCTGTPSTVTLSVRITPKLTSESSR